MSKSVNQSFTPQTNKLISAFSEKYNDKNLLESLLHHLKLTFAAHFKNRLLVTFKSLGLSDEVLKVIEELGFEKPTDIQEKSIPILMEGDKDFIGLAQTGTGKTAAFGLPLIEGLDMSIKTPQALILAPTRELGKQIAEQLFVFAKYLRNVSVLPVYGGAAISNQIRALKKTQHIIIATPGRLIDLINRRAIKLDAVRTLVLDEADEMLNMGFKEDIDEILKSVKNEHNTWLFSATMPSAIRKIVKKYMDEPYRVEINREQEVNVNIEHQYVKVKKKDKTEALKRFLDINPEIRAVVFCRTRRETQELAEILLSKSYKVDALHGDLSQNQRDQVMARFKNHKLSVLIATDVAARGIDVNDLTHVFHHSLPDELSYYTHRSGRTARAGKQGKSIVFISGGEDHRINRIQNTLGIEFTQLMIPSASDISDIRVQNWCKGIMKTRTKNKVDTDLLEKTLVLFGNLSKEELIEKFLKQELDKLSVGDGEDINDYSTGRSGGGGRGGRGGSRYRPDRGRSRGRGRGRDGGGGSRRGGGGGGSSRRGFSGGRGSSGRRSKPRD